jgi:hypothetical protein
MLRHDDMTVAFGLSAGALVSSIATLVCCVNRSGKINEGFYIRLFRSES